MTIQQQVRTIGEVLVKGLQTILGEKLYGAYIYGAAVFPDALPTGDLDFHVILNQGLTDRERSELERLHEGMGQQFPALGSELDGYYLLLRDARCTSPPRSQMGTRATDDSWALHREHIRAGRHIVLYGPDPRGIYPPTTWPEIEQGLRRELDYVKAHLQEYPDYCILNLCRLIYSFEKQEVVISKAAASDWALEALPLWKRPVELARKSYSGLATPQDREFMLSEVGALFEFACNRIEKACEENANRSDAGDSP